MIPVVTNDSFDYYYHKIQEYEVLSPEEENELAKKQLEGCIKSAQKLVLSNLRFVVFVAKEYRGYNIPMADLVQEGNIGLMKAVKSFDPTKGVRLASYAVTYIKSAIMDYAIKNYNIVKIATTKAHRKLFFNLRSMKNKLNLGETDLKIIAKELNVTEDDVHYMNNGFYEMSNLIDINSKIDDENEENLYFEIESDTPTPDQILISEQTENNGLEMLSQALAKLDNRSREIIHSRWLKEQPDTLKDLSHKYGVSIERIRQIEQQALKKMKAL